MKRIPVIHADDSDMLCVDVVELAKRFYMMAIIFETLYYTYFKTASVDFSTGCLMTLKGEDENNPSKTICKTVSCHGGWAHVYFKKPNESVDFTKGSESIAKFLNLHRLTGYISIDDWARVNSYYWGNHSGHAMFHIDGYRAFGRSSSEDVDLLHIANWYKQVSVRLLDSAYTGAL